MTPPPAAAAAPAVAPRRTTTPTRTRPRRSPEPARRPRPRRAAAPAQHPRRAVELAEALTQLRLLDRLIRGRAWIGLLAFALIGIVAMQLWVLKLNAGIGRAVEHAGLLERQNTALSIQNSEASAGDRVEQLAAAEGMVAAAPGAQRFLSSRGVLDTRLAAAALAHPVHTPTASATTEPGLGQSSATSSTAGAAVNGAGSEAARSSAATSSAGTAPAAAEASRTGEGSRATEAPSRTTEPPRTGAAPSSTETPRTAETPSSAPAPAGGAAPAESTSAPTSSGGVAVGPRG